MTPPRKLPPGVRHAVDLALGLVCWALVFRLIAWLFTGWN